MRLYEISEGYTRLQLRAEDGEDIADELALLDGELSAKAQGVLHVLRNLEGDALAVEAEIARLSARKLAAENNAKRIREYLRSSMEKSGLTRVQGPAFSVSLSDGPERVEVDDAALLPEAYVRTKTTSEPNKAAILAAYKTTGEVIPGTRIERGTRLVIK